MTACHFRCQHVSGMRSYCPVLAASFLRTVRRPASLVASAFRGQFRLSFAASGHKLKSSSRDRSLTLALIEILRGVRAVQRVLSAFGLVDRRLPSARCNSSQSAVALSRSCVGAHVRVFRDARSRNVVAESCVRSSVGCWPSYSLLEPAAGQLSGPSWDYPRLFCGRLFRMS